MHLTDFDSPLQETSDSLHSPCSGHTGFPWPEYVRDQAVRHKTRRACSIDWIAALPGNPLDLGANLVFARRYAKPRDGATTMHVRHPNFLYS